MLIPLQAMGIIFVLFPPAALLPVAVHALFFKHSGQRLQAITASAWLLYTIYESAMQYGGLCGGECNIRIDLLAIYPALLVLSLLGLIRYFMFLKNRKLDQ